MDAYYVHRGRLFLATRQRRDETKRRFERVGESLILYEDRFGRAELCRETVSMRIYTLCADCDPVLNVSLFKDRDLVEETRPWVEYELRFEEGSLHDTRAVRVQRREDVAATLRGFGRCVLDDEDQLAVNHRRAKAARGVCSDAAADEW